MSKPLRSRWVTGIGAGMVAAALSIGVIGYEKPLVWLGIIGAGWLGYGIATNT